VRVLRGRADHDAIDVAGDRREAGTGPVALDADRRMAQHVAQYCRVAVDVDVDRPDRFLEAFRRNGFHRFTHGLDRHQPAFLRRVEIVGASKNPV